MDPGLAHELRGIEYVDVATVTLALPRAEVGELVGTGFLVPPVEGALLVGCTWLTSKWPHLADAATDTVLLRCMVGRDGDDRWTTMDDVALVAAVRERPDPHDGPHRGPHHDPGAAVAPRHPAVRRRPRRPARPARAARARRDAPHRRRLPRLGPGRGLRGLRHPGAPTAARPSTPDLARSGHPDLRPDPSLQGATP